ncbi:MAG: OsmC family protein [Euzebyaceae bacterium]|nr:OsmC family protein [Euzebyaceae bacterium]
MTGTLGGALEARKIPAGDGRLRSVAVGEIELDGSVLVIKRIHVRYTLVVDDGVDTARIDRVMGIYADRCPVHRSISGCIDFTDEIELRPRG